MTADPRSRWGMIAAGIEIVHDSKRRIRLRADAEEALMRGARMAEEVTVSGAFLADLCEALIASMPGDAQNCDECSAPFYATARDGEKRVFVCKAHLHDLAIRLNDENRALRNEAADRIKGKPIAPIDPIEPIALVRADVAAKELRDARLQALRFAYCSVLAPGIDAARNIANEIAKVEAEQ